jgi:hypothetical protein
MFPSVRNQQQMFGAVSVPESLTREAMTPGDAIISRMISRMHVSPLRGWVIVTPTS